MVLEQLVLLPEFDDYINIFRNIAKQPGSTGRPLSFPPEFYALQSVIYAGPCGCNLHGLSRTISYLWTWLTTFLRDRYNVDQDKWNKVAVGSPRCTDTRHTFARFRNSRMLPGQPGFELLKQHLATLFRTVAKKLGMFDPTAGSTTHPSLTNTMHGDGTVYAARVKKRDPNKAERPSRKPKQKPKNPKTDPDARTVTRKIDGVEDIRYGIPFTFLGVEGTEPHRRLIYGIDYIPRNTSEGPVSLELIRRCKTDNPELAVVVWDKLFTGKYRDALYQLDIQLITDAPLNTITTPRVLGTITLDSSTRTVTCVLIAQRMHIAINAAGNVINVPTTVVRTRFHHNADGRVRPYQTYRIPNQAPVPKALRGKTFTTRIDSYNDHNRTWGLPHNLASIPDGTPIFEELRVRRPASESTWSQVKAQTGRAGHQRTPRAPAYGWRRNQTALTLYAVWNNYRAWIQNAAIPELDQLAEAA